MNRHQYQNAGSPIAGVNSHTMMAGGGVSNSSNQDQNTLNSLLTTNIYECSLHGILTTPQSTFIQRVKGMMRSEQLVSWKEMVYKTTIQSAGPSWAEGSIMPSEIHVRYERNNCFVRYIGTPQIKDNINAMIRNVVDIKVSDRFFILLSNLGYVKDYEYFVDGYCYSTYSLALYLVNHRRVLQDGTKGELLIKNNMVELQCLSGEEGFMSASEHLNTYAEYLYPFIELIKFDHRNLILDPPSLQQSQQQ
ncbi:putative mediator complex subunit 18 [Tieghemostelium lacteum]|uniref:Mediator of RNA polymerase II transcription subunit 18 n=1 Tax=Tieghemostelium lacteum TaxID=361077 RepID=A0A151ZB79_TIELA|nr:putative mediator complex subunit 18 [Tieghemostelium lacteum]|eukprot:KYQ91191.1 putative mediator complex subunit 18 [Tieghemostelium lacteum]